MNINGSETIAAIATPAGFGAIGIVRMSGPEALTVLGKIFRSSQKNKNISDSGTHTLHYGEITDGDEVLDEVLAGVMKAPNSYTGEDMIEITCHGNAVILDGILELCLKNGAKAAGPGEFTRRAFLNGRIDLSQAESVNRLIHARSQSAVRETMKILKGNLGDSVREIKEILKKVQSGLDADIEWGETENINTIDGRSMTALLRDALGRAADLAEKTSEKNILDRGIKIVICGKPNAGKSSLYNCLLNMSRSIVNSMPGTTRDVISAELLLGTRIAYLVDTAGLGSASEGEIEKAAAEKSTGEIETADTVIYMIDPEQGLDEKDHLIKNLFRDKEWLPVINKSDLGLKLKDGKLEEFCGGRAAYDISCRAGKGIEKIKSALETMLRNSDSDKIMVSHRQKEALLSSVRAIRAAAEKIETGEYTEIISFEIRQALEEISRIDGSSVNEEILDMIFSEFCIGK
ncbi:MAG: tRNA uridine-5-carboxymethylaminomethyl(34) synthesis GTPase MnmE [Elusimicrobia bacterium]|nr:tRNA uridine-5-carboxymethylaminomethyl(34) synthesis GTPase MnmE [Elusimicrobiota bacterium]